LLFVYTPAEFMQSCLLSIVIIVYNSKNILIFLSKREHQLSRRSTCLIFTIFTIFSDTRIYPSVSATRSIPLISPG